ncbi:hypothetical protein [Nocardia goodfellowii]|uniref:Gfo/Idh/MocA-like oxidoreductase N-terminal domain-containing protein n=1 Tax=Nocardia goodfellowii TaxID=882446 RepID=A0ABS4QIL6_9NOCA|nr:hypothetical protein [Nocardia goodfellowii]MBP2191500.1 hypothetical protein [Nocardia goodfellowii]
MSVHQLVVIGYDEIVANKYMPCIQEAIDAGHIDSWSLVDLEGQREAIEERLVAANPQPRMKIFVPADRGDPGKARLTARTALNILGLPGLPMKTYIATEVGSHERYLRQCVDDGMDSLVEKPVLAPMLGDRFDPAAISTTMSELIASAGRRKAQHSVMTLSRYHRIYNDRVITPLRERMLAWKAPLTSFHLRAAGGVWNLEHEFITRDDHPYRYGYGMLMHGSYHYVDLAVQVLELNKLLFPDKHLRLQVSSFGAWPSDQWQRLSRAATRKLGGDSRCAVLAREPSRYGETDITSTFRLIETESETTITLGTLSFEQTTPSIRNWTSFPDGVYNKNGRTSSVDLEAQLSTLYSIHVNCYDVPQGPDPDKIGAAAEILTRTNAALLTDDEYVRRESFDGVFHSDSNRALMQAWLAGTENRSRLAQHVLPMRVTEALALSLRIPGQTVEIDGF